METLITGAVGRNDPCPCGSGKKYKNCCGQVSRDMRSEPILQSIQIENFRSIKTLNIGQLSRINLLAGKNSVGKTAALEAAFLLVGAENINLILKISQFRGIHDLSGEAQSVLGLLWAPLFHNLDTTRRIRVEGRLKTGKMQKVEFQVTNPSSQTVKLGEYQREGLTADRILQQDYSMGSARKSFEMSLSDGKLKIEPVPADPWFPGFFLVARKSPSEAGAANLLGKLIRSKKETRLQLVEIMKIVDPRLEQLNVIPTAGNSMIYGDIGLKEMIPLSLMGDGLSRVADILLSIANAANGIVLIDEIENGLHHSILERIWEAVGTAANAFNTQVIATTHSYECIQAAHKAFNKSSTREFLLHRLDRVGEQVKAITYDQETLTAAIKAEFEVR